MIIGQINEGLEIRDLNKPETIIEKDLIVPAFDYTSAYISSVEELDDKTIKFIERQIRTSYEYRSYIAYLKGELDLTKCSVMKGIDVKKTAVSLEFHHYPFNLYELTKIVGEALIETQDRPVSTLEIANLVMAEHYRNNVGLVPLTTTLHELAHSRSIIIPFTKIVGNWKSFLVRYKPYIDPDIQDRIVNAEITNTEEYADYHNSEKLKSGKTNYNITYLGDEENKKGEE